MKNKILLSLALTFSLAFSYGQTVEATNVIITNNKTSTTATKVNVQESDGKINHKPLSEFGTVKAITGTDGITVADGTLNPVIGISIISQLKVAGLVADLGAKLEKNNSITAGTKTKITYDSKGLVISGADATTADIADTTDKRYQTDLQKANNDATSSIQKQLNSKATDANVLHKTGDETKTGNLKLIGSAGIVLDILTGQGDVAGIRLRSQSIVNNNPAINVSTTVGDGVVVTTSYSGFENKFFKGVDQGITTSSIDKLGTITGTSLVKSGAPTTNLLLAGGEDISQSKFLKTTGDQFGINGRKSFNELIYFSNATITPNNIGTGLQVNPNGTAVGILNNNSGTNYGYKGNSLVGDNMLLESSINGKSNYIANINSGGTGFNFIGQNEGVNTYTVNKTGDIVGKSVTLTGQPETSAVLAGGGVLANPISGTGTTNYLPILTASRTIGNSAISQNTNDVLISKKGVKIGSNDNSFWSGYTNYSQIGQLSLIDYTIAPQSIIGFNSYYDGTGQKRINTAGSSSIEFQNGGDIAFYNDTSKTAGTYSNLTNRMTIKSNGIINFSNAPIYTDNTTALSGGLVAGDVYRTAVGVLMITY